MKEERFSSNDIRYLCQVIINYCDPTSVLYIGMQAKEIEEEFKTFYLPVRAFEPEGFDLESERSPDTDTLLVDSLSVDKLSSKNYKEICQLFTQVVVILFSSIDKPSLPEISAWFLNIGYCRRLGGDFWIDDRILLCIFEPSDENIGAVVSKYEKESWRLLQLSQKRRLLLTQYFEETVHLSLQINSLQDHINDLQKRTDELEDQIKKFWESRTGKILLFLRKAYYLFLKGNIKHP